MNRAYMVLTAFPRLEWAVLFAIVGKQIISLGDEVNQLFELIRQAKVPHWGSQDDSMGVLEALDQRLNMLLIFFVLRLGHWFVFYCFWYFARIASWSNPLLLIADTFKVSTTIELLAELQASINDLVRVIESDNSPSEKTEYQESSFNASLCCCGYS